MSPTRTSSVRWLSAGLSLLCAVPVLFAAPRPRPDRVKVLIERTDARPGRVPVTAASLGGEEIAEYPTHRLVSLPSAALNGLQARLAAHALHATVREDFDILYLPAGTIDVRRGLDPAVPTISYGPGEVGLHVVQFAGPATTEWMEALAAAGAKVILAVPQNGRLVAATPEAAQVIGRLRFVQWVSPFEPRFKAGPRETSDTPRQMRVEIAEVAEGAARQMLSELDPSASVVDRDRGVVAFVATLPDTAADALLRNGLVVGVTPVTAPRFSDERQVLSTTTNIDVTGNQPALPGSYASWLSSRCGTMCSDLAGAGYLVGVADSGLDSGKEGTRHAELQNVSPTLRMIFGNIVHPSVTNDDDRTGHGTMVAGVIAGKGITTATDADGFLLGQGVAPSAGIVSTKIANDLGQISPTPSVLQWAVDATNRGAYIQNSSFNYYNETAGTYTTRSAEYDRAVRDSNGSATAGGAPITLTVPAGNIDPGRTELVAPPATAKNVIAVGGAENFRMTLPGTRCRTDYAHGFMTFSEYSKRGTAVPKILAPDNTYYPWSTYIKPDLTAPATYISSARGPVWSSVYCVGSYLNQPYMMESGTSFAAPLAAGAALLASRVFAGHVSPSAPASNLASPALLKAMLIAGARSMRGGTDRLTGNTIATRPNDVQGFGLVSTADLFDDAGKSYVNQAHTFTSSANPPFVATYTRRDSARQVKVALTWSDAPWTGAQDQPPLLNDLDLVVNKPVMGKSGNPTAPCSRTYWGNNPYTSDLTFEIPCHFYYISNFQWNHDYRNNAELVIAPAGTRSEVKVSVVPKIITAIANPAVAGNNQDFALYTYNATQRGDFNHDGRAEIVWRNPGTETRPRLWLKPDGSQTAFLDALPQPWTIEGVGDFDANGSDDLVIQNPTTGEVSIRLMNKLTLMSTVVVGTAGASWDVGGAGDFDTDGHPDIILWNHGTGADAGKIRMWRMNGTTLLSSSDNTYVVSSVDWRLEGIGDLNMDGWPDLVWHHRVNGSVVAWLMSSFTIGSSISFPYTTPYTSWRLGGLADYNNDGYTDLLWQNIESGTGGYFGLLQAWTGPTWSGLTLGVEPDVTWRIAGPR